MESWSDTLVRFGTIFVELLVLFIVVTWALAILQRKWLSPERIQRYLGGKRRISGLFKGALLGAVTPFCSCAGVPILVALVRAGVPFSTSMAFLISSPLLDVPILGLIGVLYGWEIVIVYTIITFFGSMALAAAVDAMGMVRHVKLDSREQSAAKAVAAATAPVDASVTAPVAVPAGAVGATGTGGAAGAAGATGATAYVASPEAPATTCSGTSPAPQMQCNGSAAPTSCDGGAPADASASTCGPVEASSCGGGGEWKGFRAESRDAWQDSVTTLRPLIVRMFIGVAIGALIYGGVPQGALADLAGPGNPLAVPVAALIGIPLYLRGEAALPIGYALLESGVGIGAVFAMVIAGAGASLPELTMLSAVFKRPLLTAFVLTVFGIAVLGGWVIPIFA